MPRRDISRRPGWGRHSRLEALHTASELQRRPTFDLIRLFQGNKLEHHFRYHAGHNQIMSMSSFSYFSHHQCPPASNMSICQYTSICGFGRRSPPRAEGGALVTDDARCASLTGAAAWLRRPQASSVFSFHWRLDIWPIQVTASCGGVLGTVLRQVDRLVPQSLCGLD